MRGSRVRGSETKPPGQASHERAQRVSHACGAGRRGPASERVGGSGGAKPPGQTKKFSLFQSQSGAGWDLAISGPRFRKVFTLYGPADDLPGLVSAYVDAIITQADT